VDSSKVTPRQDSYFLCSVEIDVEHWGIVLVN
jgi:hypothetical protein